MQVAIAPKTLLLLSSERDVWEQVAGCSELKLTATVVQTKGLYLAVLL